MRPVALTAGLLLVGRRDSVAVVVIVDCDIVISRVI